jgi:hypothetical protein
MFNYEWIVQEEECRLLQPAFRGVRPGRGQFPESSERAELGGENASGAAGLEPLGELARAREQGGAL